MTGGPGPRNEPQRQGLGMRPAPRIDATQESAREHWRAASPIAGTLGERYYAALGVTPPLPPSLRFSPACWHSPSGRTFPAVLAVVMHGVSGAFMGVWRGFIPPDNDDDCAILVKPSSMLLGPCRGGAVRLGPVGRVLIVSESLLTGLKAQQRTGVTCWFALSAAFIDALDLPAEVVEVEFIPDSSAGHASASRAPERWPGCKIKIVGGAR